MDSDPIYLDFNATTPLSERVQREIVLAMAHFGNPSSSHVYGKRAKQVIEKSRQQVAGILNCAPCEIIFTSGGTEANNTAIKGVAHAQESRGKHIITSAIEHPAVLEVCQHLESKGFEVTYLPVDSYGVVSPDDLERAITDRTTLVTIMHSNNEVGTLQPIKELAAIAHRRGALFHTDASQSVGKVAVDVADLGVDLLTIAGHKLYAPKGVGALYIRSGVQLEKFMHGASHERNLRAGTESTLLVAGLGAACDESRADLDANAAHMRACRDLLRTLIVERFPTARINGHQERVLPNTLSVSFLRKRANELIEKVESRVAVSAGAACHAGVVTMMSHVLKAMQVPFEHAVGTIRFSTGRATTEADIRAVVDVFQEAVERNSTPREQPTEKRQKTSADVATENE
eukprot:TRINITY_DN12115_c0_g1_i2.p1 TRINITY_DN12115_c0_g1~~TRINITY_DN12115_c0_g1_i2.p1  ORF type:complete len:402 (+),score=109.09 TRINITY_DN12115_c0_g1_i2:84-1289(+)